jgi:hypothetical protein
MASVFSSYVKDSDPSIMFPLETVKRALKVYHNEDDDEIESLIPVAIDLSEKYMKRLIGSSTVTVALDTGESPFFMPYGNVTTIESVEIDGVESTGYTFNMHTQRFTINVPYKDIVIVCKAGLLNIPAAIDRAVKFTVSTLYNSGQDFTTGVTVVSLPLKSSDMLEGYRYYVS